MTDAEDPAADADAPSLEERLGRLEAILSQLEADEVPLERALELFEEGVGHVRAAEKVLAATELRVEELLADGTTAEFDEEPDA
ncbi:MAG: exodeoxyribonuclease VII small subunit [Longimicrobiales bacterium]